MPATTHRRLTQASCFGGWRIHIAIQHNLLHRKRTPMASLATSLSRLRTLRELFETRLRARSGKTAPRPARPRRLQELTNFGSNPGNLRMHAYVPDGVGSSPALVVALHGCTQTAVSYDQRLVRPCRSPRLSLSSSLQTIRRLLHVVPAGRHRAAIAAKRCPSAR